MDEIEKAKIELEKKLREQEQIIKECKRLDELLKLPFYLRIQAEGNEEQLKRVEATQEWTMKEAIKKRYPSVKGQEKELFAEFFSEYLRGECASIRDFMEKRKIERKEFD